MLGGQHGRSLQVPLGVCGSGGKRASLLKGEMRLLRSMAVNPELFSPSISPRDFPPLHPLGVRWMTVGLRWLDHGP